MPTLNHQQLSTVLAALRFWQRLAVDVQDEFPEDNIAMDGGIDALTSVEIDALCRRLNTEPEEFVAVAFDALSLESEGYSHLTLEQKNCLASKAANIFAEFEHNDAISSAFSEAAELLGYKREWDEENSE